MKDRRRTKKDPNLIFDVGLHRGQDSDFYLKKGFRVVAFEADPENAEFCRRRFEKEIDEGQLTIVEGAITDNYSGNRRNGTVRFYRNEDHSLWGSTSEDWAVRNKVMGTKNEIITVKAIDFTTETTKYGVPHYLKADIVGSEMLCLRALLNFENKPDYLSIRSEKLVFRKLEAEFQIMRKLGYVHFKAIKQEFENVIPTLPSANGPRHYHFEEGASGPFGEETDGKWKTADEVMREYRRIFIKYWLFGDYSYLIQTENARKIDS